MISMPITYLYLKIIDRKIMQDRNKKELPVINSNDMPESLDCTTCFLPMQYQKKIDGKFIWQCFRCGKKYFVFNKDGKIIIEETWGPPR